MIRKAVIVVLTISSFTVAYVMLATFIAPQTESFWRSPYWRWKSTLFRENTARIEVGLRRDHVWVSRARVYQCPPHPPMPRSSKPYIDAPGFYFGSATGFTGSLTPNGPGESRSSVFVVMRLSALLLLFSAYPIVAFIRGPLRRYRRRRKGLCVQCAYDLTGNVSGVCPECAAEVEKP